MEYLLIFPRRRGGRLHHTSVVEHIQVAVTNAILLALL